MICASSQRFRSIIHSFRCIKRFRINHPMQQQRHTGLAVTGRGIRHSAMIHNVKYIRGNTFATAHTKLGANGESLRTKTIAHDAGNIVPIVNIGHIAKSNQVQRVLNILQSRAIQQIIHVHSHIVLSSFHVNSSALR